MMASACLALSGAALALVPTSHVLPGQLSVRTRLAGSLMREDTKDVPLTYSEYLAQKNGQAAEPAAAPFDEGVAQSPTVPMGNPPDFGKRLSQLEGGTDGVRRMLGDAQSFAEEQNLITLISETLAKLANAAAAPVRGFADGRGRAADAFAMDLFSKYDFDNSGYIDKDEFKSVASEMKAESNRRTVLQLASAVVGSVVVAKYSEEFAFAQKTFRSLYVEGAAEQAHKCRLPGRSLARQSAHRAVCDQLLPRRRMERVLGSA